MTRTHTRNIRRRYFRVLGTECDKYQHLWEILTVTPYHKHRPLLKESAGRGGGSSRKEEEGTGRIREQGSEQKRKAGLSVGITLSGFSPLGQAPRVSHISDIP